MTQLINEILEDIRMIFSERYDPEGRFLEFVCLGDAYDIYHHDDPRMKEDDVQKEYQALKGMDVHIPLSWYPPGSTIARIDPEHFVGYAQLQTGLIVPFELAQATGMRFEEFNSTGFFRVASIKGTALAMVLEQAMGGPPAYVPPKGEILHLDEFR